MARPAGAGLRVERVSALAARERGRRVERGARFPPIIPFFFSPSKVEEHRRTRTHRRLACPTLGLLDLLDYVAIAHWLALCGVSDKKTEGNAQIKRQPQKKTITCNASLLF